MTCPLCLNKNIEHYYQDKIRDYWQCQCCQLVYVKPEQYISTEQEKKIYDLHQNNSEDDGYRNFLDKLLVPLEQYLKRGMIGLDFGCGPSASISDMFAERGFQMKNYDIFYANNPKILKNKYDFITCTEVIEHLHHPHQELTLLSNLLNNNGHLGIMTKRVIDKNRFANWHYKNDQTHVCFYSEVTFEYIAKYWKFNLHIINSDSVILQKL
jgi:2-polyprenyl-3-methyl-5-hydroxy-6-metoxy-1,4-benzoquinol methylase